MKIRQSGNGDYYAVKKNGRKNIFIIKSDIFFKKEYGILHIDHIYFPKEWIGKRIRLKIEVL